MPQVPGALDSAAEKPGSNVGAGGGGRIKILLADDSVTMHRAVSLGLRNEPFEIITCDNGQDALRLALEHMPRVVLADLDMPGLTGVELCQAIREQPTLADTRVVLLCGSFDQVDESRLNSAQADGRLWKPFESHALVALLHTLLKAPARGTEARQSPTQTLPTQPTPLRSAASGPSSPTVAGGAPSGSSPTAPLKIPPAAAAKPAANVAKAPISAKPAQPRTAKQPAATAAKTAAAPSALERAQASQASQTAARKPDPNSQSSAPDLSDDATADIVRELTRETFREATLPPADTDAGFGADAGDDSQIYAARGEVAPSSDSVAQMWGVDFPSPAAPAARGANQPAARAGARTPAQLREAPGPFGADLDRHAKNPTEDDDEEFQIITHSLAMPFETELPSSDAQLERAGTLGLEESNLRERDPSRREQLGRGQSPDSLYPSRAGGGPQVERIGRPSGIDPRATGAEISREEFASESFTDPVAPLVSNLASELGAAWESDADFSNFREPDAALPPGSASPEFALSEAQLRSLIRDEIADAFGGWLQKKLQDKLRLVMAEIERESS